jgi:cell division protein FtsB
MRKIIKVGIALFFILGSLGLGRYFHIAKKNDTINQYKHEIDSLKNENIQLKDSIYTLWNSIDTIDSIYY